jgi:hypothetical protein
VFFVDLLYQTCQCIYRYPNRQINKDTNYDPSVDVNQHLTMSIPFVKDHPYGIQWVQHMSRDDFDKQAIQKWIKDNPLAIPIAKSTPIDLPFEL